MPTEQRAALVACAVEAGVRRSEVTNFVHPKPVPQMANAEALMKLLPHQDVLGHDLSAMLPKAGNSPAWHGASLS